MLIESFVLDCDKCILQTFRNLIYRHIDTVGTGSDESLCLVTIMIIYRGLVL